MEEVATNINRLNSSWSEKLSPAGLNNEVKNIGQDIWLVNLQQMYHTDSIGDMSDYHNSCRHHYRCGF